MEEIKVALVQSTFLLGDIPDNISKAEILCAEAAEKGAKIVVFPEVALTGDLCFLPPGTNLSSRAVRIPGEFDKRLEEIARINNAAIVIGGIEADSQDRLYNTSFVFSPDGYLGKFRKWFVAPSEKGKVESGSASPIFELFGWQFGIGICYDIYFPEIARLYALKGADALLIPTGGTGLPPHAVHEKWWKPWFNLAGFMKICPARALDNDLYILLAVSADAGGGSVVVDPFGEQIAYGAGEEEIITTVLRPDRRNSASREYLRDLRPVVYERLRKACESSRNYL